MNTVKREIYKASFSGNEYLLSFTARRLMANLRKDTLAFAESKVLQQMEESEKNNALVAFRTEELSCSREALVSHINRLETANIELRDSIAFHQKRQASLADFSNQQLLLELIKRDKTRWNLEPNTSPFEGTSHGTASASGNSPLTPKATPDTVVNSFVPGAVVYGQPCGQAMKQEVKLGDCNPESTSAPKRSPALTVEYRLAEHVSPDQSLTMVSQSLDLTRNCLTIYLKNS